MSRLFTVVAMGSQKRWGVNYRITKHILLQTYTHWKFIVTLRSSHVPFVVSLEWENSTPQTTHVTSHKDFTSWWDSVLFGQAQICLKSKYIYMCTLSIIRPLETVFFCLFSFFFTESTWRLLVPWICVGWFTSSISALNLLLNWFSRHLRQNISCSNTVQQVSFVL